MCICSSYSKIACNGLIEVSKFGLCNNINYHTMPTDWPRALPLPETCHHHRLRTYNSAGVQRADGESSCHHGPTTLSHRDAVAPSSSAHDLELRALAYVDLSSRPLLLLLIFQTLCLGDPVLSRPRSRHDDCVWIDGTSDGMRRYHLAMLSARDESVCDPFHGLAHDLDHDIFLGRVGDLDHSHDHSRDGRSHYACRGLRGRPYEACLCFHGDGWKRLCSNAERW